MLDYQNIKVFLQKAMLQIGLKKFLLLKKLKILFRGHFINDLNGEKIVGTFDKKDFQKTKQKQFSIEKVIKTKGDNKPSGMDMIVLLIVGLIKKT